MTGNDIDIVGCGGDEDDHDDDEGEDNLPATADWNPAL